MLHFMSMLGTSESGVALCVNAQRQHLQVTFMCFLAVYHRVCHFFNQDVVKQAETLKSWTTMYTAIPRQKRGLPMKYYEAQLGKGRSVDNSFVNLFMCIESEFFVGTMGSTWSVVIDGLRRTSGKEARGMISVNRNRYWDVAPKR